MSDTEVNDHNDLQSNLADVAFCAFALSDCVVHVSPDSAKYLRAVHRTALELAVPNLFGYEIGGYWLTPDQIGQLRKLPECYPANEVDLVKYAIEAFLRAQTSKLDWLEVGARAFRASTVDSGAKG
ncbi:MAG TPA: hypothetical protein VNO50_04110 [Pyrinomonadaceae bacterium]|nr:hypothetical protein [Pyrinomonadaceae bacterium]